METFSMVVLGGEYVTTYCCRLGVTTRLIPLSIIIRQYPMLEQPKPRYQLSQKPRTHFSRTVKILRKL